MNLDVYVMFSPKLVWIVITVIYRIFISSFGKILLEQNAIILLCYVSDLIQSICIDLLTLLPYSCSH